MKNESCDTIVSCYYDLRASNDRTLDILNFPLFPLINGERTTLKELNADIYLNNPLGDALLESTKCPPIKILKNSHPYSYIYHDVKQLKKFDYLHFAEHHVFKKWFEKQDEETCHKHLEVLRQHTLNFVIKRNNQLFEKIKCLKFVVGEDNSKYSISELYDPTIALFQSFGKNLQLVFPSTQFAEPKWISLLKPLGMITTINKSFVVRCLMLLMQEKDEKLAIEKFSELKPYIELFSEDVDVINNAVVPIVKLDQTKYPNCMKVDTLFKNIKNVVDYSSVDLVFTTKHVFNHSYLGYIKKLHPNYKIESIDVYNHLKTICQLPITENTSRVVKNIYNHLHKYTVDMPKDLQEYPVVLLNNEFIRPNRVFSSIEKDYKPFIYKLHPEYLKSLKFFQCVGVEDQPSREICRSLLNELFYMNKDQTRCNPTQVDLSLYLIRTLVTKYNDDLFDSYLLDHRIALQQINHITVNNAPYLLKKIHDDTFNFLHPELIDLASKLNLKYLSQQVTSEYSSGDKIEQATKYDVQSIQSKIRSPEFRSSVLRLFMNQMSHCEQIPINKYNNLQEQLKKLESIEVSEVDQIQCIYRHDGKDISRRDVEPVSSCVYEQSMLLLPQRYSNLIDIYLIIARELNKSFMLQDQSLLLILLKTDIENMVSVLDEYGVPNTEDNTLSLIRKLGHQVDAEDDHKFVVPVSADNVTVDELVAYIKDNIKYYGRVLCIKNYCSIDTGSGAVEMKLSDLLKYQEAVTNVTLNAPSRSPIDALKDSLRCSISRSVFVDPVVACDGVTYEREYILSWFSRHMTSPVTNLRLENTRVIPNLLIKTIVSDFSFEN
ncbi:hypothetical protein AKO1_011785 [Acrasis kona]|uniref:U-box domain-containing protein n=1 Tax=Acrasis kona TaxID=1008807 RepID=A0AAW2Z656_9EUKA